MFNNIKIGTKLLVINAVLVAVPLIIVTYFAVMKGDNAIVAVADAGLENGAHFVASDLDHSMLDQVTLVQALANDETVVNAAESAARGGVQSAAPEIAAATRSLTRTESDKTAKGTIAGLVLIDPNGEVVAASRKDDLGRSFAAQPFFAKALGGAASFGEVARDSGDQWAYLPVAAPVHSANGSKVVGVLMEQFNMQFVQGRLAGQKLGSTSDVFVIDRNGLIVADTNVPDIMKVNVLATAGVDVLGKQMKSGHTGVGSYAYDGIKRLAGFAPIQAAGWSVALTVPASEYLAPVSALQNLATIIAALAVILALLILFFFVRSITRPLKQAVSYAEFVAAGDFTQTLSVNRKDEVGQLTGALNEMVMRLQEMIAQVRGAADNVASSSEEISGSAQQLASGAQNQASTLEQTSASVEELTSSVEQVADHAQSQAASVEESSSNMEQMRGAVEQVSKTLAEVSSSSEESMRKAQAGMEAVSKAVEAIRSISASSEQIAGIITVISDIADQTNLLALNASIEAARAGEHGRGFAVVADEVSKLAERSSTSTKEIGKLIKESAKSVISGVEIAQAALGSMEGIIAGARRTNEMVSTLAADIEQQMHSIEEVAKATESISEMSQSISAATEEQTTNAKQVAKAVENVNELTQAAASAAEEMSAATEELSSLAQELQRLVEQFKLSDESELRELPEPQELNGNGKLHVAAGFNGNGSNGNGQKAERRPHAGDGARVAHPAESEESGVMLKKQLNGERAHR